MHREVEGGCSHKSLDQVAAGSTIKLTSDSQTYVLSDWDPELQTASIRFEAARAPHANKRVPVEPKQILILRGIKLPDGDRFLLAVQQGSRFHFGLPTSVTGITDWSIGPVRHHEVDGVKIF